MLIVDNVTFDCADPRRLAEFWSKATGYQIEQQDEHMATLAPGEEGQPKLLFIPVPEPKTVKNRVHLDLVPAEGTRDAELARLLDLGSTVVDDLRQPDGSGWVVLADPEGNEFCVFPV